MSYDTNLGNYPDEPRGLPEEDGTQLGRCSPYINYTKEKKEFWDKFVTKFEFLAKKTEKGESMSKEHVDDFFLADDYPDDGGHGLDEKAYAEALEKSAEGLGENQQAYAPGPYEFFLAEKDLVGFLLNVTTGDVFVVNTSIVRRLPVEL